MPATVVSVLPLSPRQRQLLATIEKLTRDRDGLPPTLREVSAAMNVHPSRVAQLARSAEEKGALAREPRTARSWKIIKSPSKRQ
jgi:SOS-response transcriptional repressor LexA